MADVRVVTAARIGEVFGIDPVVILDTDIVTWQIRVAALRVIAEDRRREVEEAKKG